MATEPLDEPGQRMAAQRQLDPGGEGERLHRQRVVGGPPRAQDAHHHHADFRTSRPFWQRSATRVRIVAGEHVGVDLGIFEQRGAHGGQRVLPCRERPDPRAHGIEPVVDARLEVQQHGLAGQLAAQHLRMGLEGVVVKAVTKPRRRCAGVQMWASGRSRSAVVPAMARRYLNKHS